MSSKIVMDLIPPFESFESNQLTIQEARHNRDALVHQIDTLVDFTTSAPLFVNNPQFYASMRVKYRALIQQEKLYRKYTFALFSSKKMKPLLSSSNIHHTVDDTADIPDLPDHPQHAHNIHNTAKPQSIYSSNIYHSDEEKCEHEHQIIPRITRIAPPPNAPVPYIEDEHTKEQELLERVAILLFIHWPHTINVSEIASKYWDYYQQTLDCELPQLEQLKHDLFVKKTNPFASTFSSGNINEDWNEACYYYELSDIESFFMKFAKDKQYELIRAKVAPHFAKYHPQGLLRTELKKLFRYWVAPALGELAREYQEDLFKFLFDEHKDNMQLGYIVTKGSQRTQFPLVEPWKVYALNAKQMMICILSQYDDERNKSGITLDEFQNIYRDYFGVDLDWKSHHNQSVLINLIDQQRLQSENVLTLSKQSIKKHDRWIKWWRNNGYNKKINMNNTNINMNANNMNTNINKTQYGTEEYKDIQYPRYNTNYHDNNNNNNYDNQRNRPRNTGGGRHESDCLLYICGFPHDAQDPQPFLDAIEKKHDVKFNNFNPAHFKHFQSGIVSLCPIPLLNAAMTNKLIDIENITLQEFPNVRLRARLYVTDNKRRYDNNRGARPYNSHRKYNDSSGYSQRNMGYNQNRRSYDNY